MIEKELRAQGATYKIVRKAGSGGSASVYKAVRADSAGHSRQTVALKILKEKNAIPWLRKEFETLSRIRSVHCAQVLAWENLPIGPALVMEWIDGVTLLEFAKGTYFHDELIAEIVLQIKTGLSELNASGLHHGDLSPGNILIDQRGVVRLVDFATAVSTPGEIVGTPAFLSPAIWNGFATSLESDLFALSMIEHDLRSAFSSVPKTNRECRARAFDFVPQIQDLSLEAAQKTADPLGRMRLAAAIADHLEESTKKVLATQVIAESVPQKKTWPLLRRIVSLAGIIGLGSMVAIGAQAPMPSADSETPASITVASHNWVFVQLNGKDVGYTPIHLKTLRPGRHRLAWRTSKSHGETLLEIAPGEKRRVTEADLSRLE